MKRERCSSSAGNDWTGAKGCCGWARVSSCSTSGLKTEDFPGLRNSQEAAELTEEQYHYLMMGLNPLDPKIKEVKSLEDGLRNLCKTEKFSCRI